MDLTEKVQFQMPFYGNFSDVKIDQEDVFASIKEGGKLRTQVSTDSNKMERQIVKEHAKRLEEQRKNQ